MRAAHGLGQKDLADDADASRNDCPDFKFLAENYHAGEQASRGSEDAEQARSSGVSARKSGGKEDTKQSTSGLHASKTVVDKKGQNAQSRGLAGRAEEKPASPTSWKQRLNVMRKPKSK